MNNILLSIVVPVYNVEKYLSKCLDSLVGQTLSDIEIIIVNDASPDNSQNIINEYKNRYTNKIISLVNDKNRGQGYSRNVGISKARGKYIGFADPDDWVDLRMFERLYFYAEQGEYEITMCDMFRLDESNDKRWVCKSYCGDKHPSIEIKDFVCYSLDPAMAWNKIYKCELFKKAQFPEIWYEDMGLIPILLSYAKKIGYVEEPLYFYRQSPQSITSSTSMRTLEVLKAWDRVLNLSNPEYSKEITFAVYKSICSFMEFKTDFINYFFEFFKHRETLFIDNPYIQNEINRKRIINLFKYKKTPLIPHIRGIAKKRFRKNINWYKDWLHKKLTNKS